MSEEVITSRHNPLVKHARAVRDGRVPDQIFIEGLRLSEEAARARLSIQDALYTEKFSTDGRASHLLDELRIKGARLVITSEEAAASISDTKTPQGIFLLAARPRENRNALLTGTEAQSVEFNQPVDFKNQHEPSSSVSSSPAHISYPALLVILHRINNPANAGAILRTAEAAGATGAIATIGTADLYGPKALRGAMGSSFRLPLWTGASYEEALLWCAENGIGRVGAVLGADLVHTEVDWTAPCALVVGPEASGLNETEAHVLDEKIRIPMRPPVESLNVSVATGVILYEAARQRSAAQEILAPEGRAS